MGSGPESATPRRCRALLGSALLATALVVSGAAAAQADDPAPTPAPTPGTTVSPPSQEQIEDARNALDRLQRQGSRNATPARLAEVAGPTGGSRQGSVTSRLSDEAWWTVGAGLLVLLVSSEATRLSARRAKHRGSA